MWFEGLFQIVLAQSGDSDDGHPLLKLLPVLIFVGLSLLSKLAKAGSKKTKTSRPVSAPPMARPPAGVPTPPAGPVRKPMPPYAQKSNLPYAVKTPPPAQSGTREVRPAARPAAQVPRAAAPPVQRPAVPSRTQVPVPKPPAIARPAGARPVPPGRTMPPSAAKPTSIADAQPVRKTSAAQIHGEAQAAAPAPATPVVSAFSRPIHFAQPQTLIQAVIYSEILGKPVGLRQNSVEEF